MLVKAKNTTADTSKAPERDAIIAPGFMDE